MEVTDVDVAVHRSEPDPDPIADALQELPGAGSVEVTVHTDAGVSGTGEVGFGRIQGAPDALGAVIEHELVPVVEGTDPAFVRRTHGALREETDYHGAFGLSNFGIAALDVALWDCLGRHRGVPCWELWGAARERLPAYAMVGWSNYGEGELREVCRAAAEQGFAGVKVKVGSGTLADDVERVEAARDAAGDGVEVMVDANQALATKEAIRRGRAFEELDCAWFEEPIPADDVDGYAELAGRLDLPVATGENLHTRGAFARFLRRDAVDIVQPDLRRAGGPTALLGIGTMADAFNVPYASHGGGAAHCSVMACLPNTRYLETGLLDDDTPFDLDDGTVGLPRGPGFAWA